MKLKAVLAVTAALSFGGAFAQANFSDVPAGHWAKDAVDKMAAQGCIIGFPDGTFRGNESLTRYQAALILARCLQEGTVTAGTDTETLESIKNAIQELSSELAALGVRVADVEDNAATKDDVAALEERVAALENDKDVIVDGGSTEGLQELQDAIDALQEAQDAQIADLTATLDDLVAQLDELAGAQEDLASRVEALETAEGPNLSVLDDLAGQIDDLTAGQDELSAGLEDLTATVDELTAGLDDLNARVDELSAANEETAAVLDEINSRIEELAGAIDDVNIRVDDLEGTVGDVSTTVDGLGEQVESNAASIVALQDLTVLLNEDIVGLEDRISALESDKADVADVDARFTNLNRDLTDLTNRVTVVETNLSDLQGKFNALHSTYGFTFSGDLSYIYYVSRVKGRDFDIDRLIPGTKFSTGSSTDGDGNADGSTPVDYADFNATNLSKVTVNASENVAMTWVPALSTNDFLFIKNIPVRHNDNGYYPSRTTVLNGFASTLNGSQDGNSTITLNFSVKFNNQKLSGNSVNSAALSTDTQAFAVQSVAGEFGFDSANQTRRFGVNDNFADPSRVTDKDQGYPTPSLYLKGITTEFTVAGNPLTFKIGPNIKASFTNNVLDASSTGFGDGYVANADFSALPGIGGLKPTLQVLYSDLRGSDSGTETTLYLDSNNNNFPDDRNGDGKINGDDKVYISNREVSKYSISQDVTYYLLKNGFYTATAPTVATVGDYALDDDGKPKTTTGSNQARIDGYLSAVRGTVTPVNNVTLGVTAGRFGTDDTTVNGSLQDMVFGVDLNAQVAGWTITSEYANQNRSADGGLETLAKSLDADYEVNQSLFYVKAQGALGPVSLGANYRQVSPDFTGLNVDSGDNLSLTYGKNQKGFGADVGLTVAGFTVKGYFDSKTDFAGNTNNNDAVTKLGVSISGQLGPVALGFAYDSKKDGDNTADTSTGYKLNDSTPAPDDYTTTTITKADIGEAYQYKVTAGIKVSVVDLTAFYQNVYVDGVLADNDDKGKDSDYLGGVDTQVGADAKATIANVNLAAGYKKSEADYSKDTVYLDADTSLTAGILTIKPEFHFKNVSDADAGSNDTTMFKVAATASTAVLDTFLKPSFNATVSYYQNAHTDVGTSYDGYAGADFTSSELYYKVGVKADDFLFAKSTFALAWAGWNGTNRKYTPVSAKDSAGSFGDDPRVGDVSLSGIYGEWTYNDLNFAYGDFTLKSAGEVNHGQAFKISYKVKF